MLVQESQDAGMLRKEAGAEVLRCKMALWVFLLLWDKGAGWTAVQLASYKAAQHLHAASVSLLKLQTHQLGSLAQ